MNPDSDSRKGGGLESKSGLTFCVLILYKEFVGFNSIRFILDFKKFNVGLDSF